ncbi:MAG: MFS transporter [Pseudomonadota bacterium]
MQLAGIGLQGTLLVLRANSEGFALPVTGIMMSAYFLGFVIGTFLCPTLIRSVGHIRAFSAFAAITAAAAITHGILIDPWFWTALRIISGMAMVGIYIVVESWLIAMAPVERRGRFLAVYTIITLLAMALAQYLILVDDIGGYRLFSVTALLMALAVVPIALTRIQQPAAVFAPPLNLQHLHRISPLGFSSTLISGIINGAFWGLGALFARRIGMDDTGIALFMSLTTIGGVLLQWPIGHISDTYDRRHVLVWSSLLTAGIIIAAYFSITFSHTLLFALAMIYGGFSFALYGISVAHVNDHLDAAQILEASRALLLVYGAGAVLGPSIAGYFMQLFGPGSLLLFIAVNLLLLGLLGIYRLRVGVAIPPEAQMDYAHMVRTSQIALELDPRLETETGIAKKTDGQVKP